MSRTSDATMDAQEKLVDDIKSAISDAEEILEATAGQTGDAVASLRARIQARLQKARVRLVEAEAVLRQKTREAAQATDAYVHESPWTAIGIAAGVAFVLGVALGRR